ncbi:MAG TPA: YkvA family protein [Candidatus Limnocylindrales bacterium]|nr:YkvA family protein [Candidatus Limnocylindrales bacterium]
MASRRGIGRASISRIVSLLAFLPVASRVPDYARLIGALVLDERMPAERKVMLGAAAGYLVLGRDLIPDNVPLIGGLDDLVVVVLAVDVFLDGVPPELLQEKLDDLAIDRVAFERDVAQIRRLTPGPVRRTIRRVPGLISSAGHAIERSGIVPRTRAWINKEEPTT